MLIACTVLAPQFLLYGVAAIPYLLFAQDDPPQGFASKLCFVPLSPIRAALVVRTRAWHHSLADPALLVKRVRLLIQDWLDSVR